MKRLCLVTLCALVSTAAISESPRWVPIGAAADGSLMYMERPKAETREVPPGYNAYTTNGTWVKVVSPEVKAKSGTKPKFASAIQKIEFDCSKRRIAIKRVVYYDQDGEAIKDEAYPTAKLDEPIPESTGEAMLLAVCIWTEVQKSGPTDAKPQKQSDTSL